MARRSSINQHSINQHSVEGAGSDGPGVDPRIVAELVQRAASPGFDDWWASVANSGYCTSPVHLTGTAPTGRQIKVLARCKNRRSTICPSCSRLYAGDTWQLVHRGLLLDPDTDTDTEVGGVRRPVVFATLTAPSYGAVHRAGPCHPRRRHRCRHASRTGCGTTHRADDGAVGTPLCLDCYDYTGHVLFTWHAPELWHRYTIALRRALRRTLREMDADPTGTRLSYVKIVELQHRGVPHYHAVFRLDPTGDSTPVPLTGTDLAGLITRAATATRLRVPGPQSGPVTIGFGEQIDAQPLDLDSARGRAVAGYLAKYVTKSVADLGLTPRRLSPHAIDRLDVNDFVRRILHTIIELSEHPDRAEMVRWLHTLAYRGHVSSKTRQYSTTMGALRANRATWQQQARQTCRRATGDAGTGPDDSSLKPDGDGWRFTGIGHASDGERLLAVSAAARAGENLQAARDNRVNRDGDDVAGAR